MTIRASVPALLVLALLGIPFVACSSSEESPATQVDGGQGGSAGKAGGRSGGTAGASQGGKAGASHGGTAGAGQGGTGGTGQGGQAGTGGASQGGAAGSAQGGGAGSSGDYLPGDEMAAWEGGPAYYSTWSHGPSTDPAFFPLAVWLQAPEATATATQYRDIGINTHVGLWKGPTEAQLTAAAALPTTVISEQNSVGLTSPNNGIIKAWMHQDEPDNAQNGTEDPVPTDTIVNGYKTMVAADATRPVFLNFGQGAAVDNWYGRGHRTNHPEDYPLYAQGADVVSFDIYPMNVFLVDASAPDWKKAFHDLVAQHLWFVAAGVDRLREWTAYKKPVWAWIETTNFNGQQGFALTPALVRAEVWMALVHGARGIGYFCHVFEPSFIEAGLLADAAMKDGVHALNDEILNLAPVLNTQSVSNGVTTASSDANIPVDTMVKRSAGFTYVFAVSMRPGTTTATFTLRSFTGSGKVEVLGESREIAAAEGVFQDTFVNHAVHLYRIHNP